MIFSSTTHQTIVDVLRERAANTPARLAFEFLEANGATRSITYGELDMRARAVAAGLGRAGQRALLLYSPGIDYIVGFFGCLYARVIAVPVYLPTGQRGLPGMIAVSGDAGVTVALGDRASLTAIRSRPDSAAAIAQLATLVTDEVPDEAADDWSGQAPGSEDLAFLQYTSGTTGAPKGVMVRHANLIHNSAVIRDVIGADPDSRCVSWLPPYHDMGLVGAILQPVYAGYPSTLLAPMTFLRKPMVWLAAISRTRATASVAPDFAYLECARRIDPEQRASLDLSNWRHALTGAEPVRASTMAEFVEAFAPSGFRRSAFVPCYGLAEATLFVSGNAGRESPPAVIEVGREELASGRAVTGIDASGKSVALTSCGRPRSDDLLIVVGEEGEECEPGTVGEIWVSGRGVTAGYWGRPEETERVFGARSPGHGERAFLRTGDQGFVLAGELFVTGRNKDLMIVRGRNHYPHDLEHTAERAHPDLRPSGGAAFSVDDGVSEQVVLVHEVVRGFRPEKAEAVVEAVREAVVAEHGLALHDVVLVRRGAIPRTTSGKIRRGSCRHRWMERSLPTVSASPTVERPRPLVRLRNPDLADTVGAVLGVSPGKVGADTSLVANGLDSLTAVRLAGAVRDSFGVEVPVDQLLDGMTLCGLDHCVNTLPKTSGPPRQEPPGRVGATRAQQWMWLLDQRIGASGACHVVGGVRLTGGLDPLLLWRSLNILVDRHEALRSVFRLRADGGIGVEVLDEVVLEPTQVDVSGTPEPDLSVRAVIDELAEQRFQLEEGPLLRAVLIRGADDDWFLGVCAHHIVVDGWSLGLLLSELGACYRLLVSKEALPALPSPASAITDSPLSQADTVGAERFWREHLNEAQAVDLPLDHPMPTEPKWKADSLPFGLSLAQTERLKAYAAAHDATPFMVLIAGLGAVLARWTGQDKPVIGTPSTGRDPATAEHIGMFVNVVPTALDMSGSPTFGQLVDRARTASLSSYPHRRLPFEQILRLAGPEKPSFRAPLVRVVLVVQNVPMYPWQVGDVRAEPFERPAPGAQFELYLRVAEHQDGRIAGHVVYMSELFESASIQALLDALRNLLDTAPTLPDVPVADLPLFVPTEERGLSQPPASLPQRFLHERVEERAVREADACAVTVGTRSLSYRDMEADANRLARLLRDYGVGPEDTVLVETPMVVESVVAVLAVLKAGACVALGASEVRPKAVLGVRGGATGERWGDAVKVWLDTEPQAGYSAKRVEAAVSPRSLALVDESGLLFDHTAAVSRMAALPTLGATEVVLAQPSVVELMWLLGAGATVVLRREGDSVLDLIVEHGVTTLVGSADSVDRLLAFPDPSVGMLRRIVCREPLPFSLVDRVRTVLPSAELVEPAIVARADVFDTKGRLLPLGAVGEIRIGGEAVPRGYANGPARTAERFPPDPVTHGSRLYRTGWQGRWTAAGKVETVRPTDRPVPVGQTAMETDIAPRNQVELRLAGMWSEVLGLAEVPVNRDFFELGGHSLLATRVAVRIRSDFGVDVPVAALLAGGLTVAGLAERVQADQFDRASANDLAELLEGIAGISDEQAAQLLSGKTEFDS
ncbi:AMP-binding protein [Nocardiopsis ansamitocini]|uniref:Non-ribosomal peptide synthetase n=1 Tax=Nocardiopsis ansamitocini TaxID=1670832 RepID=A0A9W6P9K8_9ACTN|nr:AMP-binding protein [Nocardiopsis ansamitocini]GLU50155.1 non-ribosomal peptide synthetase [Nocardiopsis ansamitocini]